jgi:hypothetical protein
MAGRRSPERTTDQASSSRHSEAGPSNPSFDATLGTFIPQQSQERERDFLADLFREEGAATQKRLAEEAKSQENRGEPKGKEVQRDFLADLFRKEGATAQAQLTEKDSDKKREKRPMKAAETLPETKRTNPEQSADNQGNASRSNETKPIDLKKLEQISVQAPHSREGTTLLVRYYTQLDAWLHQNQFQRTTQEYQTNEMMRQKIDRAIKERTKAALQEIAPKIKAASSEWLQDQQEKLNSWLEQSQSCSETAIYQLNKEVMRMVEGRLNIKKQEEQLAQTSYVEGHHQHLLDQRDELAQWFEKHAHENGTEKYRINEDLMQKLKKDIQRQEEAARQMEASTTKNRS